jgi:2-methylisocitrate lyase-like PEP mutase family enzyme
MCRLCLRGKEKSTRIDFEIISLRGHSKAKWGTFMKSQDEKGRAFYALHQRQTAFVIPNPWDIGTARLLAQIGFPALATTSGGYAFSLGLSDGAVSREQMMEHVSAIAAATDLPVSADLENGFGDEPETAAETIRLAAKAGACGGSIEDVPRNRGRAYEFAHALDRVRAAVEAVRSLPFRFTLTARAENFIIGNPNLADTIKRLQGFQEAGADVLFAPGLTAAEDIAAVVRSVDRPVNVIMGLRSSRLSVAELAKIGVRRISVGSALSRAALGAFLRAAHELKDRGTFEFAQQGVDYGEMNAMFQGG